MIAQQLAAARKAAERRAAILEERAARKRRLLVALAAVAQGLPSPIAQAEVDYKPKRKTRLERGLMCVADDCDAVATVTDQHCAFHARKAWREKRIEAGLSIWCETPDCVAERAYGRTQCHSCISTTRRRRLESVNARPECHADGCRRRARINDLCNFHNVVPECTSHGCTAKPFRHALCADHYNERNQ